MRFRAPSRPLAARLGSRLFLSIVALAALFAAAYFGTLGIAHAQGIGVSSDAVAAATTDLSARTGVAVENVALLRGEAVTWRDGCLGVYVEGEFCTLALVDGFVLWLGDGASAYRYHTNTDGSVLRFAEGNIPLAAVDSAPLPDGIVSDVEEAPAPPALSTTADLLAALREGTGLPILVLQTFAAVTQPFISVPGAAVQIGTAYAEVYELPTVDDVQAVTTALQFDGAVSPPANATLWATSRLIVILTDAPSHIAEQDAISAVIGDPLLLTIAGPLLPGTGGEAPPSPGALPSTGSGGLTRATQHRNGPAWVWAIVAGVLLVLTGANYGVQRRFTTR